MKVVTTLDELERAVGEVIRTSEWVTIDQERIDAFADVTDDHQWIHVDTERAAQSPYGGTIAHGMLTASIAGLLPVAEQSVQIDVPRKMTVNYGFDRIRFPHPVRSGSRIRTVTELVAVARVSPGVVQMTNRLTVQIEGVDKPAMVADILLRLYVDA
jgi:acyl dehydratase